MTPRAESRSQIHPGDGDPRHGTENGYVNLTCRCPDCTAAHSISYSAKRRKTRPPLPPGDPRHGTDSGYRWWKCRCPDCRSARTR